ncbi:hypothetical protein RI065_00675 [Mycoplasmatota bacterium zrk1]
MNLPIELEYTDYYDEDCEEAKVTVYVFYVNEDGNELFIHFEYFVGINELHW